MCSLHGLSFTSVSSLFTSWFELLKLKSKASPPFGGIPHHCPLRARVVLQVAIVRASDFYGPGVINSAMGGDFFRPLVLVSALIVDCRLLGLLCCDPAPSSAVI